MRAKLITQHLRYQRRRRRIRTTTRVLIASAPYFWEICS